MAARREEVSEAAISGIPKIAQMIAFIPAESRARFRRGGTHLPANSEGFRWRGRCFAELGIGWKLSPNLGDERGQAAAA